MAICLRLLYPKTYIHTNIYMLFRIYMPLIFIFFMKTSFFLFYWNIHSCHCHNFIILYKIALGARIRPMAMMMGPVTTGGKNFIILRMPNAVIRPLNST